MMRHCNFSLPSLSFISQWTTTLSCKLWKSSLTDVNTVFRLLFHLLLPLPATPPRITSRQWKRQRDLLKDTHTLYIYRHPAQDISTPALNHRLQTTTTTTTTTCNASTPPSLLRIHTTVHLNSQTCLNVHPASSRSLLALQWAPTAPTTGSNASTPTAPRKPVTTVATTGLSTTTADTRMTGFLGALVFVILSAGGWIGCVTMVMEKRDKLLSISQFFFPVLLTSVMMRCDTLALLYQTEYPPVD